LRNVLGRVSYGYLPGSKLSLSVMDENGWRKLQRAHPPAAVATQNQTWEYDPTRTTLTTLQAHHAWSDEVSTEVGAYYRYMTATLQQYENGLERDNREDKRGVFLRQAVQFPEVNTVRVGGELAQWRNPTGKLYYEDHARDEKYYSLFAQDELKVIPERLTLDAGVRWDRTYINKGFTQSSSVNQAGVNPGGIEIRDVRRDPAVSYSTGAKFDLTHSQSLTARYSVSQMSTDSSIVSTKNTALPDARETREELGYQIRFQEPKLTLGLVGFMSQIDNGVIYSGHKVINGIDTGIYASNDFTRMGLELSAEGALVGGLSYFFTGTWIDPRNDTLGAFQNTMPRYMLAAGLGYQVRGWKAAVYAKNVPPYDDNSFTGGPYAEIGDYYQVDANLSYTIHAAGTLEHEIYGGVRNLANQHYETVVGYPDPGIWPYIGYILRF
jgi:outer membrane cobalamin receptor